MPMDLDEITRRFHQRQSLLQQLLDEGLFILKTALADDNIRVHLVTARLKTLGSFIEKAKKKQFKDPISETHDLAGIRVVCLFLSDVERIGALIRKCFEVVSEDDKIEGAMATSFGYMSVHFDVTMKSEHRGPRYDPIAGLPLEIQVRTIAMDAWANVSHHLDYKSDRDVPSELRKDFFALSGLFYVADKHFELFYDTSKNSRARMADLFAKPNKQKKAEQEINLDSLKAYLESRFPDRRHSDSTALSALVDELLQAGLTSVGEIDQLLDSASEALTNYEREFGPITGDGRFSDVGAVRVSANIANDKFFDNYSEEQGLAEAEKKEIQGFRQYVKSRSSHA